MFSTVTQRVHAFCGHMELYICSTCLMHIHKLSNGTYVIFVTNQNEAKAPNAKGATEYKNTSHETRKMALFTFFLNEIFSVAHCSFLHHFHCLLGYHLAKKCCADQPLCQRASCWGNHGNAGSPFLRPAGKGTNLNQIERNWELDRTWWNNFSLWQNDS